MSNDELTLDISRTRDFKDVDIENIKASLDGIGNITTSHYVMKGADTPAYLFFFIEFAVGITLSGFFNALGQDIYYKIKKYFTKEKTIESVNQAFSKIKNNRKGIIFEFRSDGLRIKFTSNASDEKIIRNFIKDLPETLKITTKIGFKKFVKNKREVYFEFLGDNKWFIAVRDEKFKIYEYDINKDEWKEYKQV